MIFSKEREEMISVVIPTYNREETVRRAIMSVLNQTFRDIEVILVDDGSTDNTRAIVQKIVDSRIRYVYQDNAGACVARNRGIELARGEYIAFHDSDDVWHEDKLEKQIRALLASKADLIFCKLVKYNADGTVAYKPDKCKEGIVDPIENLFGIGTQTLLGRRKVFEEFKFDKDFPRFQEFELLYRAAQKYSIYCLDEGLVDYFVGSDSISYNPRRLYLACELLLQKHPQLVKKYPIMGARMAQYLLANALKEKDRESKRKNIQLALKCHVSVKVIAKAVLIFLELR